MDNRPIGLFDSGIGGISILDKLKELLPNENFIFLADNKNCPYGYRSKKEIISLSTKNCEKLIELNCKAIVVACNTATTNAIETLREVIGIPIIGIEPGIKPAISYTKTKNIGILATEKTLNSKHSPCMQKALATHQLFWGLDFNTGTLQLYNRRE